MIKEKEIKITEKKIKITDVLFLQIIYLIYSFAGIASKMASQCKLFSLRFFAFYSIEIFIMGLFAFLWQQIIKRFNLITAYSSKGVVIIWTLIWSAIIFKETIKVNNIFGALIVILGIMMVVRDDK